MIFCWFKFIDLNKILYRMELTCGLLIGVSRPIGTSCAFLQACSFHSFLSANLFLILSAFYLVKDSLMDDKTS